MQHIHSNKTTLKLIRRRNTHTSCNNGLFEDFSFWKNYNIKKRIKLHMIFDIFSGNGKSRTVKLLQRKMTNGKSGFRPY